MENKKLKLTISGKPKKSFKNFETTKSQGKHSVVIDKSHNKFAKKGSSFRPNITKFSSKFKLIQMILKKENLQNKEQQEDSKAKMYKKKINKINWVVKEES